MIYIKNFFTSPVSLALPKSVSEIASHIWRNVEVVVLLLLSHRKNEFFPDVNESCRFEGFECVLRGKRVLGCLRGLKGCLE